MRNEVLATVIVVVIVAIIAITLFAFPSQPAGAQITSFTTDKDLYHSNEVMNIAVSVVTTGTVDNATVRIQGISDRHGRIRLMHDIPVNLTQGPATFVYDYQLPPCSSCAGLDPGDYEVNVTILRNNVTFSHLNRTVRIEQ